MRRLGQICSILSWLTALGLFVVAVLPVRGDSAQGGIPTANPKSRYESLRAKSPFALATATAPAVAPQTTFAANWFVSGVGRIGEAYFVSIKSRDKSKEFTLFSGETDSDAGVSLVSVDWSEAIGQSTVVIKKGTETAKLEFNEAEVRAAPAIPTLASATGAPPPATMMAKNAAMGLPRGAPELSGIVRNANPSQIRPAVTPPPGNGPARVPWDAGAMVRRRPGTVPAR